MKLSWRLFAISWVVILAGLLLANVVQTSGGVSVRKVSYPSASGLTLSALLYQPKTATPEKPAPAVMVSHGLINTREMQSAFAIELARRGFVVLAIDMTGHGWSGGVLRSDGFGGPDSLKYLRSLPFVDKSNIGLEGHSLGGGPVQAAAAAMPDGYKAMVLEGSTTLFGGPAMAKGPGPRNLAVVFGQYDEFPAIMWGVDKGSDLPKSKRLQALFGSQGAVEPGKVYGDPAAGTARVLYLPPINHPQEHFTSAGVTPAIDWLMARLDGEANPLPASDQIWFAKDVGTGIAFAGFVLLVMGSFELLLSLPAFAALRTMAEPAGEGRDWRWALIFLTTAAIPALTYYPVMHWANDTLKPSALFPQSITNQLSAWAIVNGVITLALGLVLSRGKPTVTHKIGLSIVIAVLSMGVGYLSIVAADALFALDFRFWVLGLKPIGVRRLISFFTYLPVFLAFFLVAIRALNLGLAVRGEGFLTAVGTAKVAMALGFAVMLVAQYATMASTGLLLTPKEPLNTIVAYQFVPVLATCGAFAGWSYRRTNSWLPGALICALFVTWYVVSGTAYYPAPAPTPAATAAPAAAPASNAAPAKGN